MKDRHDSGTRPRASLASLLILTALLAPGSAAAQHGSAYDPATAAFEVFVTDPEGNPLDGAVVVAEWLSPGVRRYTQISTGGDWTDGAGLALVDVAPGRWRVSSRKIGHLPATGPPITVAAGEVARVELVLVPVETTEITVQVTGPVPGGGGEIAPIEGARLSFGIARGETSYSGHGTTDADGRAVFETVAAGTYSLTVEHELYPKASSIHRVTADTRTIDARLDAPPGGWASVSGRVVRGGRGAAGAEVSLYHQRRGDIYSFDTVTGEDGRFAFSAVPVGEHTLFWQPGDDPDYPRLLENGLAVRSPGTHGLELPLPRGADVRGRVENPRASGSPVEVVARLDGNTFMSHDSVQSEVDDEGRFHLRDMISGHWRIVVSAERGSAYRELIVPERVALEGGEIVLDPPFSLPDGEEQVAAAEGADRTVETRSASVVGRVVDAVTGEGVQGALVSLVSDKDYQSTRHLLMVEDDGSFAIDLFPRVWRFSITAPGYSPIDYKIDLRSEENGPAGGELELALAPTAGLALHVTMDDGGVPRGVSLWLRDPDEPEPSDFPPWPAPPGTTWGTSTLGDPVIVWEDAAAGRWLLDVRTRAGGLVTREVEITARGASPAVEVVLPSAGSVFAIVTGVRSSEMPDPSEIRFVLIDPGGEVLEIDCESCRLFGNELIAKDVPPGRYVASVSFADGRTWSAEVKVEPGERAVAELDANGPE